MKYEQKVIVETSEYICFVKWIDGVIVQKTIESELIHCWECEHDHTCTHMMVRKSSDGGNIYCPVTYCSEGVRKEE